MALPRPSNGGNTVTTLYRLLEVFYSPPYFLTLRPVVANSWRAGAQIHNLGRYVKKYHKKRLSHALTWENRP